MAEARRHHQVADTALPALQRHHSEEWLEAERSPYLLQIRAHGLDPEQLKQAVALLSLSKLQPPR